VSHRVLRYEVPVDDVWHPLDLPGPIMHVAARREGVIDVWASDIGPGARRVFCVFGTGHDIPDHAAYVGTAVTPSGQFVWHLTEAT
jgi:hypothetical protein